LRLAPEMGGLHFDLGYALAQQGKYGQADLEYRKAVRADADNPFTYNNLGAMSRLGGNVRGAIADYQRALELDPNIELIHYNLAIALRAKGDLEGASRQFKVAIRLQPRDARAHNDLGAVLEERGDSEGAAKQYREAIRLAPTSWQAHYNLAGVLLKEGGRGAGVTRRSNKRFIPLTEQQLASEQPGGGCATKTGYKCGVAISTKGRRLRSGLSCFRSDC
jgi:Flp pilus assembly protein TadD